MTPQEMRDWHVLEYVYDHDEGSHGGAGLGGLLDLVGQDDGMAAAIGLSQRGLIQKEQRLTSGYHITAAGRREVELVRARRQDRGRRRVECREQFLRWVDERAGTSIAQRVAREDFDGAADFLPFTMAESEAAAGYLKQHDLIGSMSADQEDHILVWMTERGVDCIDSGRPIAELVAPPRQSEPSVTNTYNVAGIGNSLTTATGAGAVANASITNFNLQQAQTFAAAVRAAADDLHLPEEAEAHLVDIERGDADPYRAQKATKALYRLVETTTTGGAGNILGMLAAQALGISQ